jgi:hypothetical protein
MYVGWTVIFSRAKMLKTDVITCDKIREFILLFEGNYQKPQPEHTVTE